MLKPLIFQRLEYIKTSWKTKRSSIPNQIQRVPVMVLAPASSAIMNRQANALNLHRQKARPDPVVCGLGKWISFIPCSLN